MLVQFFPVRETTNKGGALVWRLLVQRFVYEGAGSATISALAGDTTLERAWTTARYDGATSPLRTSGEYSGPVSDTVTFDATGGIVTYDITDKLSPVRAPDVVEVEARVNGVLYETHGFTTYPENFTRGGALDGELVVQKLVQAANTDDEEYLEDMINRGWNFSTWLQWTEELDGYVTALRNPPSPVATGTAAERAALTGYTGQLFNETDTSVLLQWTATAGTWVAVGVAGAWTSASRPPAVATDAAYEGLTIYEQDTGKTMVLRRTTLGVAISGSNLLTWVTSGPTVVSAGTRTTVTGLGTAASPYVVNADLTVVNAGTRTTVSGAGTGGSPYVINADQTVVTAGTNATVTGAGTAGSPYVVNATSQAPVAGDGIAISGVTVTAKNRNQLANPVRNPSGLVAQRGTSIAVTAAQGTLDGWIGYRGGSVAGMTVSQVAVVDTEGAGHCIQVQRDSGNTGTQVLNLPHAIRTIDSLQYAGKQITVSVRALKGADFSAAASTLPVYILSGTGTDQSYSGGITGQTTLATINAVLTGSFVTYTATVNVPSNVTQLHIVPIFTPVGTAGAADYYRIKDVRIDIGAYALPHVEESYSAQLRRAQEFFWRCGGTNLDHIGIGLASLSTKGELHVPFPATMRAIPTLTVGNQAHFTVYDGSAANVSSAVAYLAGPNQTRNYGIVAFTTTGLTVGRAIRVYASGASGYLDFSAEI